MTKPPEAPKIYHITHVDNLSSIIAEGSLVSDAVMVARGGPATAIGMARIKQRRLTLPVDCHPGYCVGNFVPFFFCSRSVMLFLLHKGNHPDVIYAGGQGPIVHLQADMHEVIDWAKREGRRWAFSLSNAGARYSPFRSSLDNLDEIEWDAVAAKDWRTPEIKEGKQAEFLVHDSFPWELVSRMGVRSMGVKTEVDATLRDAVHKPKVQIEPSWYY